ncbi:hypothetical protein [Mesobacillus zeae]|nr:hypothetical protein [Mesobacillus zeae]
MERIIEKGYIGIAGFEVLISGRKHYFIDLNVRFNGSTSSLLLHDSILNKYGKPKMRFCNLEWTDLIPVLDHYLTAGQFVPLSLLDAD